MSVKWELELLDKEKRQARIQGYYDLKASPLASELLERMPYEIEDRYLTVEKINGGYRASYNQDDDRGGISYWKESVEKTAPDAIAKLALHLIREGKMKF